MFAEIVAARGMKFTSVQTLWPERFKILVHAKGKRLEYLARKGWRSMSTFTPASSWEPSVWV